VDKIAAMQSFKNPILSPPEKRKGRKNSDYLLVIVFDPANNLAGGRLTFKNSRPEQGKGGKGLLKTARSSGKRTTSV